MSVYQNAINEIKEYLTVRFSLLIALLLILTVLLVICIKFKLVQRKFVLIIILSDLFGLTYCDKNKERFAYS